MRKSTHCAFFAISLSLALLTSGNWITVAQGNGAQIITPTPTGTPIIERNSQGEPLSAEQKEQIKTVILAYFELRYQMLSVSQPYDFHPAGFGALVSDQSDARVFLEAELGKLAVEIKYAELNRSRYVDYEYFLDFSDFGLDTVTQLVTVSMTESSEIVYEISTENSPTSPLVASMSGLEHKFVLRNEQGQWKIVSDYYNDFLWRIMRQKGETAEEKLDMLNDMEAPEVVRVSRKSAASAAPTLPPDPSSHSYDRADAVEYAKNHALKENYNLDYPSYDNNLYGDCTNFVSQALYEGGKASLELPRIDDQYVLPPPRDDGVGEEGWYLLNDKQRGRYWNDVGAFFDFVTQSYQFWQEGPEGVVFPEVPYGEFPAGLMLGDVIQYNDGNDTTWDHAVIVVDFDPNNGHPIVASHSPNLPNANFMTVVQNVKMRFIHIERSDGYPPVKAEITQGSDDAGSFHATCAFSSNANEVYFGNCANGNSIASGFRFNNIHIPQGAQIKYAYITFTVDGLYTDPLDVKIYGENATHSATFSPTSPPASRGVTGATPVVWQISGDWELKQRRTTPDLSTLLESITMLQGWEPGNSLSFIFKDATAPPNSPPDVSRRVIAYERANLAADLFPAKLIAAYSLGEETNTPPSVLSVTRASPSPTNASSVGFIVTFSEAVTGVDTTDFSLVTSGIVGATVSSVQGNGSVYTVTVNTGSGNGIIGLNLLNNGSIQDAQSMPLNGGFTGGERYMIAKSQTFEDVPMSFSGWSQIETAYAAGITGGCSTSPLNYCPANTITRAQMAIFLLRSKYGGDYTPPPATGTAFTDVPAHAFAAAWIEQLAAEGITGGCGGGNYCPNNAVTRAQMSIFLLRAKYGSAYTPPPATGTVFNDIPANAFAAAWIEQLAAEGITGGCGGGNYCPNDSVSRAQMAVFIVKAFNLP